MNDTNERDPRLDVLDVVRWTRCRKKRDYGQTIADLEARLFRIGGGLNQLFHVLSEADQSGRVDQIWRYSSMLYDMFRELYEEWETTRCRHPEVAAFPAEWKTAWEVLAVVGVTEDRWLGDQEVQKSLNDVFA